MTTHVIREWRQQQRKVSAAANADQHDDGVVDDEDEQWVVDGNGSVLWALVASLSSGADASDNDVSGNKTRSSPNLTCSPNRVNFSNLRALYERPGPARQQQGGIKSQKRVARK